MSRGRQGDRPSLRARLLYVIVLLVGIATLGIAIYALVDRPRTPSFGHAHS
jgi:hypothetical protein